MKPVINPLAILLISISITISICHATILNVPEEYQTIQSGIEWAQNGDTVLVQPGRYNERIDFIGKDFKLIGTPEFPDSTVIDGGGNGCVVTFNQGESPRALLAGFTITNGNGQDGGGIVCQRANPTLKNLIITGNRAYQGGGVYSYYADLTLTDVIITRNNATTWGGAARIEGGNRVRLSNVLVAQNEAGDGYIGGMLIMNAAQSDLQHMTIASNGGTGLSLTASGLDVAANMSNCIVWGDDGVEVMVDFHRGRSSTLNVSYSDILGGTIFPDGPNAAVNWGADCINTDPLFIDPANGDYHLTANSPCIDSGDPDAPFDSDGTRADIGAFYFHQRDIDAPPMEIRFPAIPYGAHDSTRISLHNSGGTPLTILNVFTSHNVECITVVPEFLQADTTIEILPDSTVLLWVHFDPVLPEPTEQSIAIDTDDPDEPGFTVHVVGEVLSVPSGNLHSSFFTLHSASPNPFNSSTTIQFSLSAESASSPVNLRFYGLDGRLADELALGRVEAGERSLVWNAGSLPAGVYIARLEAGGDSRMMKVVLVK